jgi:hypothetical protein
MSDRLQLNPAVLLEVKTVGEDLVERVTCGSKRLELFASPWRRQVFSIRVRPYRFSLF